MASNIDMGALNGIDRDLGRVGREAVAGIERDPIASLVRFRMLGEKLSDIIGDAGGYSRIPNEDQFEYLKRLERKSILNRNLLSRFHKLRIEGNAAVHQGEGDESTARACGEAVRYISEWLASEIAKAAVANPAAMAPPMVATVTSPLRLVMVLAALTGAVMVALYGHDVRAVIKGEAPLPEMGRMIWSGVQIILTLMFTYWLFGAKGKGSARRVVAGMGMLIGPGIGMAGVIGMLGPRATTPDWMWMAATLISQGCLLVGLNKSWEISQRPPEVLPSARQKALVESKAKDGAGVGAGKKTHPGKPSKDDAKQDKGGKLNLVVGETGVSAAKPVIGSAAPASTPTAAPIPAPIKTASAAATPAGASKVSPAVARATANAAPRPASVSPAVARATGRASAPKFDVDVPLGATGAGSSNGPVASNTANARVTGVSGAVPAGARPAATKLPTPGTTQAPTEVPEKRGGTWRA